MLLAAATDNRAADDILGLVVDSVDKIGKCKTLSLSKSHEREPAAPGSG